MSRAAADLFSEWLAAGRAEGMESGHEDVVKQILDRAAFAPDARCSFLAAPADALPCADAEFDGAFSMESLYYWPSAEAGLRELLRVLKPGASAWIGLDFYAKNPDSAAWPAELGLRLDRRSPDAWAATLRECGFREVRHARLHDRRPEQRARHPHGSLLLSGRRP